MTSHLRLTSAHAGLLVIDVQQKLMAVMPDRDAVVGQVVRLVEAARLLEIPTWATEQYPQGLGPTVPEIAELVPERPTKLAFSCGETRELVEAWNGRGLRHLTLCGVEAHVCVAQTALDLLARGLVVQVAADAVASRNPLDRDTALRRLERAGAVISTTEAILFEWTETAESPAFRAISRLVKGASRSS